MGTADVALTGLWGHDHGLRCPSWARCCRQLAKPSYNTHGPAHDLDHSGTLHWVVGLLYQSAHVRYLASKLCLEQIKCRDEAGSS